MKYLITGLGNIGPKYEGTRHNIGFEVVEALAHQYQGTFHTDRYAQIATIKYKARTLFLVKPTTYMNHSGRAVRYWLQTLKIPIPQLLVITDDLNLPFEKLRLRGTGNDGGHNGMKNICHELGSKEYPRLRIGIDANFPQGRQSEYVLQTFSHEEQKKLPELIEKAVQITLSFCFQGIVPTMNSFN